MKQSVVYYTDKISPEAVIALYRAVGKTLEGRVAVKLHSGEEGNQNFLRADFWKPMIDMIGGTAVECNTAYDGARNTTARHRELIRKHGFADAFPFDLMDAEGPDLTLPVPDGKILKENYVGKNLASYDSLLVLSHFKGHPMGGFGGALKQLSIGCASAAGKTWIHSGGKLTDPEHLWENLPPQNDFLRAMGDAAASVARMFDGKAVYINVMKNLSVDCDCCSVAEDPCMKDVGILASTDPVAIDRACVDLVYAATDDPGQKHFIERIETRNGTLILDAAEKLGIGSTDYSLITI